MKFIFPLMNQDPFIVKFKVVLVGNTISVRHSEVFDVDWDGIEDAGPVIGSGEILLTRLDSGHDKSFIGWVQTLPD